MTIEPAKRYHVRFDLFDGGVLSTVVEHSCDTIDEALGFMYGAACAEECDETGDVIDWSRSLYVVDLSEDDIAHSSLCPCKQCLSRVVRKT